MIKENFIKLFETSFKENWGEPALTDWNSKKTLTYAQCAEQVAKFHILFKEWGIKEGDKIALIGRNSSSWILTYTATVTYGAVIVPILQDFNENDICHIINHSDSILLFATEKTWEKLDGEKLNQIQAVISLNDCSVLNEKKKHSFSAAIDSLDKLFQEKYPSGFSRDDVSYIERSNKELAAISYTSGSTGFSKGVMLPANSLAGNASFGIETELFKKKDHVLSFLPLAHAYGCAFDFLTAFNCGSHIFLLEKIPSPKVLVEIFQEVKPATIISVPLILEKIYKKQILPLISKRSMKFALSIPILQDKIYEKIRNTLYNSLGGAFFQIIIGGATLNKEVEEFLTKIKFPFVVGYGMTECGPLISYIPYPNYKIYSVGKVLDNMEVKIDSPDPENIVGEVLARGEHLMLGYYKEPEITKETIDENGWLHTGDLGTLSKDNTLYLRGRCKSMLLGPNGQNIYPEEIEAKLNNMPFVMESLVIEKNDRLIALVYPDYAAIDEASLSENDLVAIMDENRKNLNKTVASYEGISKIKLYPEEFEKTPKKNIKRFLYTNIQV